MEHPRSKTTIEESWLISLQGNLQIRLAKKLKRLKMPMKQLNNKQYANISEKVL